MKPACMAWRRGHIPQSACSQEKVPEDEGGKSSTLNQLGFTILEMLVAVTVLALLSVMLFSVLGQTGSAIRQASESLVAFQNARASFDLMTANLSQATLGCYWDYQAADGAFRNASNRASFEPKAYGRNSELHFIIQNAGDTSWPGTAGTGQGAAFQFPAGFASTAANDGLTALLSACGYYIEYGNREALPQPFPAGQDKYRFRLMQALEPSEDLSVYGSATGSGWVGTLTSRAVPVADNVVHLIFWPRKPLADDPEGQVLTSNFIYDSRANASSIPQPETANQLPPLLQVTMICLDEISAARICTGNTPPSAITTAFDGLFATSKQTDFDADLETLKGRLAEARLNYRIFTVLIPLRESKMQ